MGLLNEPAGYVDGLNLYEFVSSNPPNWLDPLGLAKWRLDLHDHGGPHIQKGDCRYDAKTLQPIPHKGVTPPKLSASDLEELRTSGIWDRLRKNVPDSVLQQAAREALGNEVAEELAQKGFKNSVSKKVAREIAEAILKKLPVVALLSVGAAAAQGDVGHGIRNAVIPADLIEDVAGAAIEYLQAWAKEQQQGVMRKRLENAGFDEATIREMLKDFEYRFQVEE